MIGRLRVLINRKNEKNENAENCTKNMLEFRKFMAAIRMPHMWVLKGRFAYSRIVLSFVV